MKNICSPAKLFLIVTIIFCLWSYTYFRNDYIHNRKLFIFDISIDVLGIVFLTFLLNYLCRFGIKNTTWLLVIIYIILSLTAIYIIKKEKLSYFEATGIQI